MPTIQGGDIADLVATTLKDLGPSKFTDLTSDYPDTVAMKRIIAKKKLKYNSGYELQFSIMTDTNQSARDVGLGYTSNVNIANIMTTGSIPWRHLTWNWAWERRAIAMNRSPSRIVDLVETQRFAGMGDAVKKFEYNLWRAPSLTSDAFYGIPVYVVKSNTATTTNDGFNGDVPSGWTTVAGVSTTSYRRWKNYATQYTFVSKDDLIKKMRRGAVKTMFKPLVEDMPTYNMGNDMGWYTNYSVLGTMEEILEQQNENLGKDVASMDGAVVFRRTPVEFVHELELDTTNPIYGLNWGEIFAGRLQGEWMVEQTFDKLPTQPTMGYTNVDCTLNVNCRNRRRQMVFALDTAMAY